MMYEQFFKWPFYDDFPNVYSTLQPVSVCWAGEWCNNTEIEFHSAKIDSQLKKDEYKCLVVVPQFFYPNHCYPLNDVALLQCFDFQTRKIGHIFHDKAFKM